MNRHCPESTCLQVSRAGRNTALELPGNIQAITEAPILARSEGYIKSRLVDLGDRVRAGQPLAEIDAPELDEQVRQAKASLDQAKAGLDQATANLQQGKVGAGDCTAGGPAMGGAGPARCCLPT